MATKYIINNLTEQIIKGDLSVIGNLTANTISATTYYNLPTDIVVTANTFNNANYELTLTRNDGVNLTANLGILSSNVTITGGTYSIDTGVVTFINNTGGTFNVSGFATGITDTYTTSGTYSNGTTTFTKNIGGTYSVSGYTLPFTGGTVSGETIFDNGLTANTFSATTYLGLPTDIRVTGGTYSTGTAIFRNNTGGTFSVTGFSTPFTGGSVNDLNTNTISATTYLNLPVGYYMAQTYSEMVGLTGINNLTTVKVLNDENKGITNAIYHLYPDGVRMWIAATKDN